MVSHGGETDRHCCRKPRCGSVLIEIAAHLAVLERTRSV
jgi:hypothetical protein